MTTVLKLPRFQIRLAHDGKWFWRLIAANGEVLGHSEGYESKEMCRKGTRAARVAVISARTEVVE